MMPRQRVVIPHEVLSFPKPMGSGGPGPGYPGYPGYPADARSAFLPSHLQTGYETWTKSGDLKKYPFWIESSRIEKRMFTSILN